MSELEALPVGSKTERLDLANAREALLELLLLKGQLETPSKHHYNF
jgi:hypothetical protein